MNGVDRGALISKLITIESTPKTHKTKNVSFGDIFHFVSIQSGLTIG